MMGLLLTESDKLAILLIAGALIIVTFIITACLVSPWCYLYRLFVSKKEKKKEASLNLVYPSFVNPESQHFHLSIVPVYGADSQRHQSVDSSMSSSLFKQQLTSFNQFENLTQLAEKARIRYSSLKPDNVKLLPIFPKLEAQIYYKTVGESSIRLYINVKRAYDLKHKEYLIEPSPYVSVVLVGYRAQRKSIINKATQSQLFRTETVKKSLNATFNTGQFVSEELPKCLLKEGSIKLRIMDEDRYANDICLGEVALSLKKIAEKCDDTNKDQQQNVQDCSDTESTKWPQFIVFTMFPIKEVKGELFAGFCFLPTSKRVNVTVIKGNIRNSLFAQLNSSSVHQAFFVRVLMFNNGKLIKKKKTSLSIRMVWGENETVSFDLPDEPNENISFMLVLSSKLQNSASPVSPNSPNSPDSPDSQPAELIKDSVEEMIEQQQSSRNNSANSNSMRKDFHVGHFVLDRETWQEDIIKRPRKQILRWYKIY